MLRRQASYVTLPMLHAVRPENPKADSSQASFSFPDFSEELPKLTPNSSHCSRLVEDEELRPQTIQAAQRVFQCSEYLSPSKSAEKKFKRHYIVSSSGQRLHLESE